MIQGLTVLNSSYNGSRDLWWVDSTAPNLVGYNVYRAYDYPTNWTKLNDTPHPGHFFRDESKVQVINYTVQPNDWVSAGVDGQFVFKIPEAPIWSSHMVKGHPVIAANPMDVTVMVDGVQTGVGRVDGQEGLVFFEVTNLGKGGAEHIKKGNPFIRNVVPTQNVVVSYRKLINYVDIHIAGTGSRTFYTVVPVLAGGNELHTPGAAGTEVKSTLEVDQMDYMFAEMVRRNSFLFEQSGEPANLMIRRTKGDKCGCLISNGEARSGCRSCYETGIVGGYFGPFEILFIDPDVAATRTITEGGIRVERASRSYLGPTPYVQNGDIIVRRNGERLEIGDVVYKMPRGVLLQQDFDVHLLVPGDTRYAIPLLTLPEEPKKDPVPVTPPEPVEIYDPRFVETKTLPSEPIADVRTDPTKVWENRQKPTGRTTKFGNIQT